MSYDEELAARVRRVLAERTDVVEKRMFGGLCFMVNGAMCCGLTKTDFMVRVGPALYDKALQEPHARPMDFTGRPLAGMVYVAPEGLRSAAALAKWVRRGVTFVSSLPEKAITTSRPKREKPSASGAKTATAGVGANGDNPRFEALMKAFRSDAMLAPVVDAFEANKNGRKFGSNGLKTNGKLFALFTQGTIVVKLSKVRVAALVEARVGTPFDPGHRRLMKEWLTVTSTKASWIDLAREAHAFVNGKRTTRTRR